MSTFLVPMPRGSIALVLRVDADATYVESSLGNKLTANLLREIADDLDPAVSTQSEETP